MQVSNILHVVYIFFATADPDTMRNHYLMILALGIVMIVIFLLYTAKHKSQSINVTTNSKPKILSSPISSILNISHPLSKDLVVFTAHVDNRPRNNHANVTMIFIAANKEIYDKKLITGCGAGRAIAKEFLLRYLQEDHLMHLWLGTNKYKYEQFALECYDLPVSLGAHAFVMYTTHFHQTVAIRTAEPVVVPGPRINPIGKPDVSVVVCTKIHTKEIAWLPEFLKYQRTLGVDHIHMAVLDEFIKDGGLLEQLSNNSFFVESLGKNYITMKVWGEWYSNSEWYIHGTIIMYLDCFYRYRGTYDFVTFMDSDDFFTLQTPGTSYKDIIMKYCTGRSTGSCSFTWLYYYPGLCGMKGKVPKDGNVTAAIVPHKPINKNKFKSIHSAAAVLDSSFHDAMCDGCMLKDFKVVKVPHEVAYVAHLRLYEGEKEEICP